MNRLAELRERCEALPERKAREYLAELERLHTRNESDAEWKRFLWRLERAEYLTGRMHHTPGFMGKMGRQ